MQRTEGAEITSYLLADPRMSKQSGVRVSHRMRAGWKRGLRWRLLYTEVDWVRTS
jgi:hypothetical protein